MTRQRPELAVGAVVVHDERLLLVQRGRPPEQGKWSLPGGRVRFAEPLADALEREVLEETNLRVRSGELVGWAERIGATTHFVIFDFRAQLLGLDEAAAGDDAQAVAWVPLNELATVDLVDGLGSFLVEHGVAPDGSGTRPI